MSSLPSTRPQRTAAKKALEKIQEIYNEYYSDDDMMDECNDDSSVSTTQVSTTHTPSSSTPAQPSAVEASQKKSKEKPTLTRISDYIASSEYNAYTKSAIHKAAHIEQIKSYLAASDEKKDRHINIPELMKYLIINPYIMITHERFNATVNDKMNEFITVMKTEQTINDMPISDQYRKEFIALSKIVRANARVNSIINLTHSMYDNIDKIATEYDKAIDSFVAAVKQSPESVATS
jgi:hypothetical protein